MAAPACTVDPIVLFQATGVDLIRGDRLLLDQVSLTIRAGEHWALLGPNGAGKSTLLQIMATCAYPTRGEVDLLGHRLGRVDVFSLRPWIGHVSPHHRVDPQRLVREVVLTGVTGGERSRTLIARALMAQPRLLLLDEPAAGLDVAGREQLVASMDDLRRRQPALATVLVTHHLEELPASTTHALLLRGGQTVVAGVVGEVVTTELVSTCFGHPVQVTRHDGRWAAVSGRAR
jgi:iron complex transport system ATP-binding protein